jgi:hypothetical protein
MLAWLLKMRGLVLERSQTSGIGGELVDAREM